MSVSVENHLTSWNPENNDHLAAVLLSARLAFYAYELVIFLLFSFLSFLVAVLLFIYFLIALIVTFAVNKSKKLKISLSLHGSLHNRPITATVD